MRDRGSTTFKCLLGFEHYSCSSLSEALRSVLWNSKEELVSEDILDCFGISWTENMEYRVQEIPQPVKFGMRPLRVEV